MAQAVHPARPVPVVAPPPKVMIYPRNPRDLPPPAPRRKRRMGCCKCFCISLISFIILLGIGAFVIWLVLKPKLITYHVQNLQIKQFTLDSNTSSCNTNISFTLLSSNPNSKIGIHYDQIRSGVLYQGVSLGLTYVPSFYQGHKNDTKLENSIVGKQISLDQDRFASLKNDMGANKIPLTSKTRIKFRLKIGSWTITRMFLHVKCNLVVPTSGKPLQQHCKLLRRLW